MMRFLSLLLLSILLAAPLGCVRRTISIQTSPPGALVWLNDREIGRTPIEVDFLYYGTYDVRLEKEGYEPMMTSGKADAPLWDFAGPDLIAELLPLELHNRVEWQYDLQPLANDEAALLERARELRAKATTSGEPGTPENTPNSGPEGQ